MLLELSLEDNSIIVSHNGFSKKRYEYEINKIKKLTFKSVTTHLQGNSPGSVSTPGTYVHSEVIHILYIINNAKQKKIELVSGEKKAIRELGKTIKALMA